MMCGVAIQGIKGSYSEQAVLEMFGRKAKILCCRDFDKTFDAFHLGNADYLVVPLRNKIVGDIEKPWQLLKQSGLQILDELALEVRHVLIGTPDAEFAAIASVESHAEALKQCKNFLENNPQIQNIVGDDTASSVKKITDGKDSRRAAIGSCRAAEIYGGKILQENIADDLENVTWFYLIGRKKINLQQIGGEKNNVG